MESEPTPGRTLSATRRGMQTKEIYLQNIGQDEQSARSRRWCDRRLACVRESAGREGSATIQVKRAQRRTLNPVNSASSRSSRTAQLNHHPIPDLHSCCSHRNKCISLRKGSRGTCIYSAIAAHASALQELYCYRRIVCAMTPQPRHHSPSHKEATCPIGIAFCGSSKVIRREPSLGPLCVWVIEQ